MPKQINFMKKPNDGVMYKPHQKITFIDAIKDILFLLVITPLVIYSILKKK